MTAVAWLAVIVFAVVYVLIATEWVHRVAAALGGAAVMLVIGATDAEHAFFSEHAGIDWNVIVLLLGMMLIVAVLQRTGVFEYLAIWAAKRAKGRPFRVMVILVLVTAVASALLDNVTTVLLVAPVTFTVCRQLGVPVVPFLIAEALASNIGGTATLVGDPPNIIIAGRAGLSYTDFLVHLAPLVVGLLVVFLGLCRWLFRRAFRYDPDRAAGVAALREREAIRDGRLLVGRERQQQQTADAQQNLQQHPCTQPRRLTSTPTRLPGTPETHHTARPDGGPAPSAACVTRRRAESRW
jgi:Na+/H+ antiporter NhaD/arsenite permease-like protein